jgi:hypothetical protein
MLACWTKKDGRSFFGYKNARSKQEKPYASRSFCRTADDCTVFMPRRAVPASPGGECFVGQVLQADLGARPHEPALCGDRCGRDQPKQWPEKASREDNRKQDPTRTYAQSGVKIEHCSRCPIYDRFPHDWDASRAGADLFSDK